MKFNLLIVTVLCGMLTACVDESSTVKALSGAGYTNIKIKGYAVFGCAEEDFFHTAFEAKGPSGQHVEGVVCSGWLKGATIRLD